MSPFACARSAVRDVAYFFLTDNWVEPKKVDLTLIRQLRDCLTVIDWYLQSRRDDIVNRLLNADEFDKCQIRDGNMGDNVSDNGPWPDYELSIDEAYGELVEAVDGASCSGETNSMQCS
jgi:hypothetical protein